MRDITNVPSPDVHAMQLRKRPSSARKPATASPTELKKEEPAPAVRRSPRRAADQNTERKHSATDKSVERKSKPAPAPADAADAITPGAEALAPAATSAPVPAPAPAPAPAGGPLSWLVQHARDAVERTKTLDDASLAKSVALGLVGGLWPLPGTVELGCLALARAVGADAITVTLMTCAMWPVNIALLCHFAHLGAALARAAGVVDAGYVVPPIDAHALHEKGLGALRDVGGTLALAIGAFCVVAGPLYLFVNAAVRLALRVRRPFGARRS